jgi:hypothetical protein
MVGKANTEKGKSLPLGREEDGRDELEIRKKVGTGKVELVRR